MGLPQRLKLAVQGMFNLNDSKWGRDGEKPTVMAQICRRYRQSASSHLMPEDKPNQQPVSGGGNKPNGGPPDLDELWRDFNKKSMAGSVALTTKVVRKTTTKAVATMVQAMGGGFQPDMKSAGIGAGFDCGVVGFDLVGYRFLHRARGSASRDYPLWRTQRHA